MSNWVSGIWKMAFTLLQVLAFVAAITSAVIAFMLYKQPAQPPATTPAGVQTHSNRG